MEFISRSCFVTCGPHRTPISLWLAAKGVCAQSEREFFVENLQVRIHLIIEMILVDRPCAMGVSHTVAFADRPIYVRDVDQGLLGTKIIFLSDIFSRYLVDISFYKAHRVGPFKSASAVGFRISGSGFAASPDRANPVHIRQSRPDSVRFLVLRFWCPNLIDISQLLSG